MTYLLIAYIAYFWLTCLLIVKVGHSLYKRGLVFIEEAIGDKLLATAINKLLLAGYYLVNLAYVLLLMSETTTLDNYAEVFALVGFKLGLICMILAGMHYFNLVVFTIWRLIRSDVTFEIKIFNTKIKL